MAIESTDDTALSRSVRSDPGGKLTQRLDIPVSEEIYEAAGALATIAGVPKSELCRRIIEVALLGELALLRRVSQPGQPGRWDQLPREAGSADR